MSVEQIKATSGYLRGDLDTQLSADTDHFTGDAAQLLKFHGIYQQDDRDVRRERGRQGLGKDYSCMVRAAIPGGALTAEQYLAMDDLAGEMGNATLRVTTRQGLQYHFVHKGELRPLVGRLNDRLVTTLAACGDVVRNVMCCPAPLADREHAGLQAVTARLAAELRPASTAYWQLWVDGERAASAGPPPGEHEPLYGPTYLPRKFKIGFAFPGDNCTDVYTNDIGIVPHLRGGDVEAFTLLVGGGLGMSHGNDETYPRLADPLGTVAPGHLVEAVKAVVALQRDHGDRDNRKHARMKYVVAEWGIDRFRAEVERRFGRRLAPARPLEWAATSDHLGWGRQGDARWFLGVRVPSGRIADEPGSRLRSALRAVVGRHADGVRFTPRQDVLLTGIAHRDQAAVEQVLADHDVPLAAALAPVARHALACPALPTCGLAIAEAERALPALVAGVESELVAAGIGREVVHVRMTGCPNGCARPYSTEVGVVGRGKDHYTIHLGGSADGTRLNTVYADRVPAADVPAVLRPVLAAFRDERDDGESFGDWCHRVGVGRLQQRFAAQPERRAS